jgi:hypothetical protein
MTTECTCDPCTYSHQDWPYGADCCMGIGIISFDYDCQIPEHAELAIEQHGPRNQQEDQT